MRPSALFPLLWTVVCSSFGLPATAHPQPAEGTKIAVDAKGRQWALLIGVEKYLRASHLRYTGNDVRRLADTLCTRGGFARDGILEMTDGQKIARLQPLKANLMAELPLWLAQAGAKDRVVVYFSGHGFRDAKGHLYLAPLDCDPDNPA